MKTINIQLNSQKSRALFGLYFGFAGNIIFAVVKFSASLLSGSVWLSAAAIYYILLSVTKCFLIRADIKYSATKNRIKAELLAKQYYRKTGFLLLLLNSVMTITIILVLKFDKSALYSGWILYIFSGYTVYRIARSSVDIKHLKKIRDPILAAIKRLGISVTLMSIFSLSSVLLPGLFTHHTKPILSLIGTVTSTSLILIALFMVLKTGNNEHSR